MQTTEINVVLAGVLLTLVFAAVMAFTSPSLSFRIGVWWMAHAKALRGYFEAKNRELAKSASPSERKAEVVPLVGAPKTAVSRRSACK
jgi:hypothetical protein